MRMAIIRVQHSFQGISLQPEDQYVNVFYFQSAGGAGTLAALATAIKGFYEHTSAGSGQSLSTYLSGISDNPGATIKMYNLEDAIPRATIYSETYNPPIHGSGASRNLPDEVALCLSYSAGAASGLPIARRRGRMYIGPFCETAMAFGGGLNVESGPNPALMATMAEQAQSMQTEAQGNGYDWSVYSPTNAAAVSITSAWVDNAWDTQRRRGNKPTTRVVQAIS